MNTPPPPPLDSFYSPYSSSFDLRTPGAESFFDTYSSTTGSDWHSDQYPLLSHQSPLPRIENRQPVLDKAQSYHGPSPVQHIATPGGMESTANKEVLYFLFTKNGSGWDEDPIIEEYTTSQSEIKKKSQSSLKKHSASLNLQYMGRNRKGQIEKLIKALNANETDGSTWEPIWIDNTKTKERGTSREVKAFEIIMSRKQPKVKRPVNPVPILTTKAETAKAEVKDDKSKKERKKSKDKKVNDFSPRGGIVDDPFGQTQWFDPTGIASGGQGVGGMGVAGLPPFIPPERPIGSMQPRIIAGLDPDKDDDDDGMFGALPLGASPFGASPFGASPFGAKGQHAGFGRTGLGMTDSLQNLPPIGGDDDDDILVVKDDGDHKRKSRRGTRDRRESARSKSRSRSRPRLHARHNSDSRPRNVRFSDHFIPGHVSSGSSVNSGDIGFIFDEVEELSSRTSEDTRGSPAGRKIYRVVSPAYKEHKPGPSPHGSRRYELVSEKTVLPERSRRRSSRAIEQPQPQTGYGVEQPLTRRNPSPRYRPVVSQPIPPTGLNDVPPVAVYPDYFDDQDRQRRDRDGERNVDNYMRDRMREQNLREREDEVAKREHALREQARAEEEKRQRDVLAARDQLQNLRLGREFGQRRSVYTHDPRDAYSPRKP